MNCKQLVIASQNIRSLGQGMLGIRKRKEFRNFIDKALLQSEIIPLQEHHLSLEDCLSITHQLDFKGGSSLRNNSLYNATDNHFKTCTAILAGSKLSSFIVKSGVVIEELNT